LLYVPLPDQKDRLSILTALSRKVPFDSDINLQETSKSKKLEGYSGADLASLVRESQLQCMNRCIRENSEDYKVRILDLEIAINHIVPSVSKMDKEKYENVI
jgi:SpoVK/Ycf46/Vps4 family AAA+-type ATPase